MCFPFFHPWSPWSEPVRREWTRMDPFNGERVLVWAWCQSRKCLKCGKVTTRKFN